MKLFGPPRSRTCGRRVWPRVKTVAFGEDAAFAGHRMQLDAGVALVAQLCRRNLQLGVDFVDDRPGAAGALVIHRGDLFLAAGVLVFLEDDNLGVLSAELDDRVDFRMQLLDRERNRCDFLHELRADQVGERAAARAGDEDAAVVGRDADLVLHALQELQQLLGLLGFVALVVLPDDLVGCRLNHHGLDGGRPHVHTDAVDGAVAGLRGDLARTRHHPRGKGILRGRGGG